MSRIYLNDDWAFSCDVNDNAPELVRLPHTNKILPLHYFSEQEYQMVSNYEKSLFVPEEWRGKVILLTIDGAAHFAEVFVNGEKCGEHGSGYTAFTIDISK